ncbi:hypothetical protein [Filifactor villosus]|uniref:Uncharacterized protein n=1 Tax=Filifactor villosus TaxID=29374 RepID=A0ABV9QL67_9FIRM
MKDLIENNYYSENKSFMYYLHEENRFNIEALNDLCEYIRAQKTVDKETCKKLFFIQIQILKHIIYHFDSNDMSVIKDLPSEYSHYLDDLQKSVEVYIEKWR